MYSAEMEDALFDRWSLTTGCNSMNGWEIRGHPSPIRLDTIEITSDEYQPLKIKWGETIKLEAELQTEATEFLNWLCRGCPPKTDPDSERKADRAEPDENELAESIEDLLSGFAQK